MSFPHNSESCGGAKMSDPLARLLLVTLEAAQLQSQAQPLPALRSWLNSWRGIGAVERGMAHQGYTFNSRATTLEAGGRHSSHGY